uniref:Uncharacterized protein n=1 Tax=Anguilla anguilla TaxID=7936 RepID=A0A0E9X071_ANGAN
MSRIALPITPCNIDRTLKNSCSFLVLCCAPYFHWHLSSAESDRRAK